MNEGLLTISLYLMGFILSLIPGGIRGNMLLSMGLFVVEAFLNFLAILTIRTRTTIGHLVIGAHSYHGTISSVSFDRMLPFGLTDALDGRGILTSLLEHPVIGELIIGV